MPLAEDPDIACGYGAFKLPPDHPFTFACEQHDIAYSAAIHGMPHRTLAQADKAFLSAALGAARERHSISLRIQAYVFFGLITAFRKMFRE